MSQPEFEVEMIVGVSYVKSGGVENTSFLVRWKNYGFTEDTWEPIDNMDNCQELVSEFMELEMDKLNIYEENEGDYYSYLALRKDLIE